MQQFFSAHTFLISTFYQNIFKFPLFSLCFSKIFKFFVFSILNYFSPFSLFPCGVENLRRDQ